MRHTPHRFTIIACFVAALLPLAAPGLARAQSALPDKYEFIAGGFNATFDTVFGLKVTTKNDVALIDFERDLGSPSKDTVLRGSAAIRFGRHQFRAAYFETGRESAKTIDRQIVWGDQVFNIGASVSSQFSTSFPGVDYTYWFLATERTALGGTLGVTDFGIKMGVGASLNNMSQAAQVDTSAIVPLLGLEFRARPAGWLLLKTGGGYVNDFNGTSVWRVAAGVEPRIYKALWLGVAFDAIKFNVSKSSALFDLNAAGSYRVGGVQVYARLGF